MQLTRKKIYSKNLYTPLTILLPDQDFQTLWTHHNDKWIDAVGLGRLMEGHVHGLAYDTEWLEDYFGVLMEGHPILAGAESINSAVHLASRTISASLRHPIFKHEEFKQGLLSLPTALREPFEFISGGTCISAGDLIEVSGDIAEHIKKGLCAENEEGAKLVDAIMPLLIPMHYIRGTLQPEYRMRSLVIRTDAGELISFHPNKGQRKILRAVRQARKEGVPVRIAIVKARQFGGTTLIVMLMYLKCTTEPNISAVHMAHKMKSTKAIFRMASLADKYDLIYCPTRYKTKTDLQFLLNDSIDDITTARAPDERGFTMQSAHFSEIAKYPNPDDIMQAAMQMIPNVPSSMVVVESTGAERGDYLGRLWDAATGEGYSTFKPVFVGWSDIEKYTLPKQNPAQIEYIRATMDEYEAGIKKAYNLSWEQLAWRRTQKVNNCGNDEDRFRNEYPINSEEAFLAGGHCVFPQGKLNEMYEFSRKVLPLWTGIITPDGHKTATHPNSAELKIYENPIEGATYVSAVDAAEGFATSKNLENSDPGVIQILRRPIVGNDKDTLTQVAVWRGYTDPDVLGFIAVHLSKSYNRALLTVEVNGPGVATIDAVKKIYKRLYRREFFDRKTKKSTEMLGWRTTSDTKYAMVTSFIKAVREGQVVINDPRTVEEMFKFHLKEGKMEAIEGHDDLVVAMCIGIQAHYSYAQQIAAVEEKKGDVQMRELDNYMNNINAIAEKGGVPEWIF